MDGGDGVNGSRGDDGLTEGEKKSKGIVCCEENDRAKMKPSVKVP